MIISEFVKTVKGQEYAYFRRTLQVLYLKIDQEPETKAIADEAARFFRDSVRRQMQKLRRRKFTGDIVVEISFFSSAKVPQPVQTLVKNYLDLLHKPMPAVDKLERILFNDDNQVKLLIANQYHGFGHSHISIKAYRFSSFVKDTEYVDYIVHDHFLEAPYGLRRGFELDGPKREFYPTFWELVREYERAKSRAAEKPEFLALFQEDHLKREIQDAYLKQNDLKIEQLLEYLKELFERRKRIKDAFPEDKITKWLRDYMFIGLDFIPMGGAPIKEGQSGIFRKHIEQQLSEFVRQHPYLFPLLRPVGLTIIVVPPAYRCPDADNLARQIIPFFDQVCQPPMTHTTLPGVPSYRTGKVRIATSGYQILYLPREADDPEDGKIMVLLDSDFLSNSSVWAKVDDVIEKWEDHIKHQYY